MSPDQISSIDERLGKLYFPLKVQYWAASQGYVAINYDIASVYIAFEYAERKITKLPNDDRNAILTKLLDDIRVSSDEFSRKHNDPPSFTDLGKSVRLVFPRTSANVTIVQESNTSTCIKNKRTVYPRMHEMYNFRVHTVRYEHQNIVIKGLRNLSSRLLGAVKIIETKIH